MKPYTKSVMTRAEAFKAAHWVEANWSQMGKMTRAEAAEALGKGIDKPVSQAALINLLRDIGKEFPGKVTRQFKGTSLVSDRPRFLAAQIVKLDEAMTQIYMELGVVRGRETLVDHVTLLRVRGGLSILTGEGDVG